MIYCKLEKQIFHLDSIKGYNYQAAVDVIKNIGWSENLLIEVPTKQQLNSFDIVSHEKLLLQLENYGIRSFSLNWFKNYIQNKYQIVEIPNI